MLISSTVTSLQGERLVFGQEAGAMALMLKLVTNGLKLIAYVPTVSAPARCSPAEQGMLYKDWALMQKEWGQVSLLPSMDLLLENGLQVGSTPE